MGRFSIFTTFETSYYPLIHCHAEHTISLETTSKWKMDPYVQPTIGSDLIIPTSVDSAKKTPHLQYADMRICQKSD